MSNYEIDFLDRDIHIRICFRILSRLHFFISMRAEKSCLLHYFDHFYNNLPITVILGVILKKACKAEKCGQELKCYYSFNTYIILKHTIK